MNSQCIIQTMEEEEKEKRKEEEKDLVIQGRVSFGPSWFWANLVLGRVGFGPTWFGPSWFWAELTQCSAPPPTFVHFHDSSSTLAMFLISFSTWTTPALLSVMSSLIPLAVKFLLDAAADLLANLSNFERSLSQSKLFVGRLSKSSGLIYKGKWRIEICGSSRTSHSTSFFRCGDSTSTKPRNYLHVSHNYIIFLDGSLGHLLPINGIL